MITRNSSTLALRRLVEEDGERVIHTSSSLSADVDTEQPERVRSLLGVATAAFFILVGLATALGSLQLGLWTSIGPGAGFFPLVLGITIGAASVVWGFQQWRGATVDSVEDGEQPAGIRSIATTVLSLVVLALILEPLGFQLSVMLFLFFHLRIIGKQKWWVSIGVTLLGSFGVYALFSNVLSVSLPTSSIPLLSGLGL